MKVGTLFGCVAEVLKDVKCKAESRKITQWGGGVNFLFYLS